MNTNSDEISAEKVPDKLNVSALLISAASKGMVYGALMASLALLNLNSTLNLGQRFLMACVLGLILGIVLTVIIFFVDLVAGSLLGKSFRSCGCLVSILIVGCSVVVYYTWYATPNIYRMRVWTNNEGKKVEARLIRVTSPEDTYNYRMVAEFEEPSGKHFFYAVERLSSQDQSLIKANQ